jgi:hypothetical protein
VVVTACDDQTARALRYAGTLAPRVVAVHLRDAEAGQAEDLESCWAQHQPSVPLVALDASVDDRPGHLLRALRVLRRSEPADLITLLMPAGLFSATPLRPEAAVPAAPGIVVATLPPDDLRLT